MKNARSGLAAAPDFVLSASIPSKRRVANGFIMSAYEISYVRRIPHKAYIGQIQAPPKRLRAKHGDARRNDDLPKSATAKERPVVYAHDAFRHRDVHKIRAGIKGKGTYPLDGIWNCHRPQVEPICKRISRNGNHRTAAKPGGDGYISIRNSRHRASCAHAVEFVAVGD